MNWTDADLNKRWALDAEARLAAFVTDVTKALEASGASMPDGGFQAWPGAASKAIYMLAAQRDLAQDEREAARKYINRLLTERNGLVDDVQRMKTELAASRHALVESLQKCVAWMDDPSADGWALLFQGSDAIRPTVIELARAAIAVAEAKEGR